MRPGRQLAVLGVIFVVLYALVFFAGASGSWKERLEPRLGLDLVGGTRMTLQATNSLDGQPPTPENLEEARRIIDNRVNALGVAEAEVVTEGDRNIVISLPGENRNLSEVGSAAELRFRKVLKVADGSDRAAPVVLAQALREVGICADVLDEVGRPPVLGHGEPVGVIEPLPLS